MTIQSDMALMAAGSYWNVRQGKIDLKTGMDSDNDAPTPDGWKVLPQYDVAGSGAHSGILTDGFSARTKLSPGDKHSIDLHAAALLSDKFQTEAGKLPTALERLMTGHATSREVSQWTA